MYTAISVEELNEEVPIDCLPDEIILKVFRYLNCAEVASSISKVCTRWQKISRDPELWNNYVLIYKVKEDSIFSEILCTAPHLSAVRINCLEHLSASIVSRMLSGCNHVDELVFYPNRTLPTDIKLKIIEHYGTHLKSLNMFVDDPLVKYHTILGIQRPSFFSLIAGMPHLKSLTLKGRFDYQWYEGELARGCPVIEEFNICGLDITHETNRGDSLKVPWVDFVENFLCHKLRQLRVLSLPNLFSTSVDNDLSRYFKSSDPLTHLTIGEASLVVTKHLSNLQSLHIIGMDHKTVRQALHCSGITSEYSTSWILSAPSYPLLGKLILEDIVVDGRHLIPNLIKVCRCLETLVIRGGHHMPSHCITAIIIGFPKLRCLGLHRVPALNRIHLKLISEYLPNLKLLDLQSNILSGGTLCYFRDVIQQRMPHLEFRSDSKLCLYSSLLSDSDGDSDSD